MPRRKTQEEFENEVLIKLGKDYKVLGKYVNKNTKIEMIHYVCGNVFMKNPHDVSFKGSGCPYCNGARPSLYNEEWVAKNIKPPYLYKKGYLKMSEKCIFYCDVCKSEFQQTPARLINEKIYGCKCSQTKKKTHNDFIEEVTQLSEDYDVLEHYTNSETKISVKHALCGTVFKTTSYNLIHKKRGFACPVCHYKKSKGELEIAKYLIANDIEYQKEFSFPSLSGRRFDFFIPSFNIAIEYDGIQHFQESKFFGGEKEFKKLKDRDFEKNKFCLENGIYLYRIPYYDIENINQILFEIFKGKSSTTIEKYLVTE